MIGLELAVNEMEVPADQFFHHDGQGGFRSIADPGEHGFTEKAASQGNTVETSYQLIILPGFDGMGKPCLVQLNVGCLHFCRNPGSFFMPAGDGGAGFYDLDETGISPDGKLLPADSTLKAPRTVELFGNQDGPGIGRPPEEWITGGIPGENTVGIGLEKSFRT